MAQGYTLYFFPSSYYSLKVYLALQEKGITFKEKIVNINDGEQYSDWFLKLNPKGQVPVLQHGENIIADSEAIIDYIDRPWNAGPVLAPDVETSVGQEVQGVRYMLNDIPIPIVTFGVLANRNLCTSDVRYPPKMAAMMNKSGIEKQFVGTLKTIRATRDRASGELRAELSRKLEDMQEFVSSVLDERQVAAVLENLDRVFDKLQDQLEKSRAETCSEERDTYWLVGNSITIADVTAAIFLYRLHLVGIDDRYFSDTRRFIVKQYYTRLFERQTVKMTVEKAETAYKIIAKAAMWKFVKMGFAVGAVALGLYVARDLYVGRQCLRKI